MIVRIDPDITHKLRRFFWTETEEKTNKRIETFINFLLRQRANDLPKRWKPSSNQDCLRCQLCGKSLQTLNQHVGMVHGLTWKDYKFLFPGAENLSEDRKASQREWCFTMNQKRRRPPKQPPEDAVTCEICQQKFEVITSSHLRDKHQMTMQEYRNLYPDARIESPSFTAKKTGWVKDKEKLRKAAEKQRRTRTGWHEGIVIVK